MSHEQSVATRIKGAQAAARISDADVQTLSSARLAVLKTWPPARLARLGRDPELTQADQTELQNFVANRMKVPPARNNRLFSATKGRSMGYSIGVRGVVLLVLGTLILIGIGWGWVHTPGEFTVLKQDTQLLVGHEAQATEWTTLTTGTVVRYDGPTTVSRSRPISFWIPGFGYSSTFYHSSR